MSAAGSDGYNRQCLIAGAWNGALYSWMQALSSDGRAFRGLCSCVLGTWAWGGEPWISVGGLPHFLTLLSTLAALALSSEQNFKVYLAHLCFIDNLLSADSSFIVFTQLS